ncbi:hypothetical protein C8024_15195 [Sphingopyxis sp. BSNA05]|nr:hypothetical protein [Sphingopyxis sp. BSNA05]
MGIYCRLSQYGFNRTDFEILESEPRAMSLFEHRLTAFVFSKLLASLQHFYDKDQNSMEIGLISETDCRRH